MGWIKRLFGIRKDIEVYMPEYEDDDDIGRYSTFREKAHVDKYEVDNNRINASVYGSLRLHYFYLKYANWIEISLSRIKDLDAQLNDHDKFYWSQELMRTQSICFGDMHISSDYAPLFIGSDDESVAIWFNTGREFMEHAKEVIRRNIYKAMRIVYQQRWHAIAESLIKHKYIKSQKDYDYYFDEYIRLIDHQPYPNIKNIAYDTMLNQ